MASIKSSPEASLNFDRTGKLDNVGINYLEKLSQKEKDKISNKYQEKINKVKNTNVILTTQKGNQHSDGYYEPKTDKLFVYGQDSLTAVNVARHELHHASQDY